MQSAGWLSLLEALTELILFGITVPLLFFERPAWMRLLRRRYSLWRLVPLRFGQSWIKMTFVGLGLLIIATVMSGLAAAAAYWSEVPFFAWLVRHERWFSLLRFIVLGLAIVLIGVLWYQLYTTEPPMLARRIFWIARACLKCPRCQQECSDDISDYIRKLGSDNKGVNSLIARTTLLQEGWPARLVAKFQVWAVCSRKGFLRKVHDDYRRAIRDLGLLGLNTTVPAETHNVLRLLHILAFEVPLYTRSQDGRVESTPFVQLQEAVLKTLWPLEASDKACFQEALETFQVLMKSWRMVDALPGISQQERDRCFAESPFVKHLETFGELLLERDDLFDLFTDFIKLFEPDRNPEENIQEIEALARLGKRALEQGRWSALGAVLSQMRDYLLYYTKAEPAQLARICCSTRANGQVDDAFVSWAWYWGFAALAWYRAPGTCPWVVRLLASHVHRLQQVYNTDFATALRRLARGLDEVIRFLTRHTLEPDMAVAVYALRRHLERQAARGDWRHFCRERFEAVA